MAKHNELGADGELVAAEFLEGKGHRIKDRNFRRPYGELDIVSLDRSGKVHLVEVKSVSWETPYRPEENIHPIKVQRLLRIIQSYLSFKGVEGDWQFDVIAVYLDPIQKRARVRYLEDVILA